MRKNPVKYRSFKDKVEAAILKYRKRFIDSAEVIVTLVEIANEIKEEDSRGKELGLTDEELAFYDAMILGEEFAESNEKVMQIAKQVTNYIKNNISIDWTNRTSAKTKIRAGVKRILRQAGFSYKDYEPIVEVIMEQAVSRYGEEELLVTWD